MTREKRLLNSYLAISLVVAVAITVSGVFGLFYFLGMTGEEPIGLLAAAGLLILVLLLFFIGAGVGGWVWAWVAKVFFGLSLKEAYAMLFDKQPDIPLITEYNWWSLKILYRDQESRALLELLREKRQQS